MHDPEFFQLLTLWIFYVAFIGTCGGFVLFHVVAAFALWVGRVIRMRALREPFAVRAQRMEDLRVRMAAGVDRIVARNRREAERHG